MDNNENYVNNPAFAPLRRLIASFARWKKGEKTQQSVPAQENEPWKNNVLRSDELPEEVFPNNVRRARGYAVFGSKYGRGKINAVTFLDTLRDMPDDAWDVSEAENRSVMAWVKPNNGGYDLYIGAEGGMRIGESCKGMFAGYAYAKYIRFGTALHISDVQDMSWMFFFCNSLTELDLSSFDTSNVQNMLGMFFGCHSLTKLDLSSFDTTNVQNMQCMFYGCNSLAELDLSSFDTTNVQNMLGMFCGCHSLVELDLSSFDTSNVQNMQAMFSYCNSLAKLDLSSFDTSNVENMTCMFSGCPAGSEWEHLLH